MIFTYICVVRTPPPETLHLRRSDIPAPLRPGRLPPQPPPLRLPAGRVCLLATGLSRLFVYFAALVVVVFVVGYSGPETPCTSWVACRCTPCTSCRDLSPGRGEKACRILHENMISYDAFYKTPFPTLAAFYSRLLSVCGSCRKALARAPTTTGFM